jgi:hypothetical protein
MTNKFKKISYIFTPLVIIFLVVIFFSEKTKNYECIGKVQNTNNETKVYLKHSQYRWWVSLWSDSIGMMWIEVPNKTVDVSTELRDGGNLIRLLGFDNELKGIFSPLSKSISVKIDGDFFDGLCKEIK